MRTLSGIILEILKITSLSDQVFLSYAHGLVKIKEVTKDEIIIVSAEEDTNEEYKLDSMGRLFPKGKCLLFPTSGTWDEYKINIVNEYYNSLLRIGDVCLMKENITSNWVLAIYMGKWGEDKYSVQRTTTPESSEFCISFKGNESYLGRTVFPEWHAAWRDDESEI